MMQTRFSHAAGASGVSRVEELRTVLRLFFACQVPLTSDFRRANLDPASFCFFRIDCDEGKQPLCDYAELLTSGWGHGESSRGQAVAGGARGIADFGASVPRKKKRIGTSRSRIGSGSTQMHRNRSTAGCGHGTMVPGGTS
ncbi:hypothetical protein GWI33_006209 [Rhynchophorus ferrugineus]|uniref:Uncharacterized protein n=1 Tax=Rhynchophorus ferrugineus TaxID=354439 RepID=A0A834IJF6_RHYFE|nr:hypothetical protein GWI33_006209 [Rhynchophorus ferrugineus]